MLTSASEPLLHVGGLRAGYGKIAVLHGIDLKVNAGEAVGLLGSNGAGKTTLLKTIAGLVRRTAGELRFDGREIGSLNAREVCKLGLVHVVDGHRVFTRLSVEDNLLLSGYDLSRRERGERLLEAFAVFPELEEKARDKAGALSGGQRQMLCVAQGLVKRPRLMMLDEPSAGLSPVLVDRILGAVSSLKGKGTSVLLVDQLIDKVVASCDRIYALNRGEISLEAKADEPGLAERIEHTYFH